MTNSRSRKWAVLFAVVATQFAVPFMLSAVGVCLPAIGREYDATAIALSLVESVFLGVNAMLLLPVGRAADICGRGGVFCVGLIVFSLATVGLTLAPTMPVFLVIRAIQAVGGSMTLATGLALLYDAFPREERGRALGISVAGIYLGISAGPFIGGLVATLFGWRWMFYAGMAPCALALVACLRNLDWRLSPRPGEGFDWPGTVTSALGIGLIVAGSAHADTGPGLAVLAVGGLAIAGFLLLERRAPAPLLRLDLFTSNRAFCRGVAAIAAVSWAMFGVSFLLSLFPAVRPGHDARPQAGTLLVIQPVVQCLTSLVQRPAGPTGLPAHVLAGSGALVGAAGLGHRRDLLGPGSGLGPDHRRPGGHGCRHRRLFHAEHGAGHVRRWTPAATGVASAMTGQSRTLGMTACMAVVTMVIAAFRRRPAPRAGGA